MERFSILHLSDLHFGRHSDQIVAGLFQYIATLPSRLRFVIVTGDLTQRAKEKEFRAAVAFLQSMQELGAKVVVIPGNHDVSLYNPYLRFLRPFRAYDKWIGSAFADSFEDESLCVVGLRTNDTKTVAEGRLTRAHAELCRARFENAPQKLRILALHHPLLESVGSPYAREILGTGPHLVLSGHRHRYGIVKLHAEQRTVLSLSAGTAVSLRTRGEENGFNWIEYSPSEGSARVASLLLEGDKFRPRAEESFLLPCATRRAAAVRRAAIV